MESHATSDKWAVRIGVVILVVAIASLILGIYVSVIRNGVVINGPVPVEGDIQQILTQLQFYAVRNGSAPSTAQGLHALVNRPNGEPQPRNWSQLIKKIPLDPWNKPYMFRNPGTMSKDGYDVFSSGPDQTPGTRDDIGNW